CFPQVLDIFMIFLTFSWHDFVQNPFFGPPIPSEWDDIESLLYTLLFCFKGFLPWQDECTEETAVELKEQWLFSESKTLPIPLSTFSQKCAAVAGTSTQDTPLPNYSELLSLFSKDKNGQFE